MKRRQKKLSLIHFQYDVNDVEKAINYTLTDNSDIDVKHISLIGLGYGATIASSLMLKQEYNVSILINPITDIAAMASSPDLPEWPYYIMGYNYSQGDVPTEILGSSWDR